MREIRHVGVIGPDIQYARVDFNKRIMTELELREEDIISIQVEQLDDPIMMQPGDIEGRVVLYIFYWWDSNN